MKITFEIVPNEEFKNKELRITFPEYGYTYGRSVEKEPDYHLFTFIMEHALWSLSSFVKAQGGSL